MTDMIAAEPHLAGRILDRLADPQRRRRRGSRARSGRRPARGAPVVVTGCGTSEHAALGGGRDPARGAPGGRAAGGAASIVAAQAFELALDPPSGGPRHRRLARGRDGGDEPRRSRRRAAAGARTALITVSARSPGGAARPTIVVETVELDHELVPHGRLPVADRRRRGRRRRSSSGRPVDAEASSRPARRRARATRPARRRSPAVLADARDAARGRLRRRPAGRPRARAEGRGGVLAPGGDARPRDVPARPPAGDRCLDRARPDPHRPRRARGCAARAGAPGARGGRGRRGARPRRSSPRDVERQLDPAS